jgi:hypothetical protein
LAQKEASDPYSDLIAQFTAALERIGPPAVPATGKIVTVGQGSNPDVDRQIYCSPCLAGNPPFLSTVAEREEAVVLLRKGEVGLATAKVGALAGVPHRLSYDEAGVLERLAKSGPQKQCSYCGNAL